jgi:outer membrane protein OmpA-like peptidoglycan-associated protein
MDNTPLPEDIQISMELTCTDCGENSAKRIIYPRLRDGIFITDLRPCHTYELTYVNASDKVNLYKNSFKTDCTDSYQEIYKEVILDKVRKTIIPVTNYTLDGLIVDNNNSLPIKGARLEVFDRKSNSIVATVNTLEDGRFKLDILKDKTYGDSLNYTFKISAMNYLTKSFELSAILQNEEKMNLVIRLDISTPGADLANLFDIKPIYFDFNKSNIRPDAKIELDKIVKIMNDNPTLVIEFGSHTDCRGTEIYNKALSERRAKSSAAYIKSRISDPSRIYGTGYGESKPLNTCECEGDKISQCSSEQHQANRRTEFKIIGK